MQHIRQIVAGVALGAGSRLKAHAGKVSVVEYKSACAADAVTTLDVEAEQFIKAQLAKHDATIGFCGEEGGHSGSDKQYWLVDPIDGTGHFVRGSPYCSTMIALVEDGMVMASAIYLFMTGELFSAVRGEGAMLNGAPLKVSDRPIDHSYLTCSTDLKDDRSVKTYVQLRQRAVILQTASAGHEFARVAQGIYDGKVCFDPYGKDWDYGPGSLLVQEAGGIVTNIGKDTYDFRKHDFIAANPLVHATLNKPDSALQLYM